MPRTKAVATSRYPVQYERCSDGWKAICAPLKLEVTGADFREVRYKIVEAVRNAVAAQPLPRSRISPAVLKVYSELIEVTSWNGSSRVTGLTAGMLPERGPYEDPHGTPLVSLSVVMVLDRLGTSSVMAGGVSSADLQAERELMARTMEWLGDEQMADFQTLVTYTDNLVHAVPVDARDPDMQLGFTMIAAAHYQLVCALEECLIRGGIVIGDHHTSPGLIAGPALIEAHHLEADIAIHPRILLSRRAAWTALSAVMRDEANPADAPLGALLRVDGDGQVFLNYLSIVGDYGDRRSQNRVLRRHRDVIRHNLSVLGDQPRPLSKWQWAAQYHNYFVSDDGRAPSLAIPADELGLDEWAFGRSFRSIFADERVAPLVREWVARPTD